MSGIKERTVSLRESEYNRIMQSVRTVQNQEQQIENQRRANQQLQADLNRQQQEAERRSKNYEAKLSGLNDQMLQTEKALNQRIQEQSKTFYKKLSEQNNQINSLDQKVERHAQEFRSKLNAQRQEYTSLIQQQSREFNHALKQQIGALTQAIEQKEQDKKSRAEMWLKTCNLLLDEINENYRHEKFAPNEFDKLQSEILLTQNNITDGDYESAKSSAQQTYLHAHEFRQKLEMLEQEWNAYLSLAKDSALQALMTCDEAKVSQFMFEMEDGSQEELSAELDYWSNGEYVVLKQKIEVLKAELDQKSSDLTTDELKQRLQQADSYQQDIQHLIEKARNAVIASHLRTTLAESIEAQLESAGWEVQDSAFAEEEIDGHEGYRNELHVSFKNLSGDEMVTIIKPVEHQDKIENNLQVVFYDRNTNDEASRRRRLDEMRQTLDSNGWNCGSTRCAEGTEHVNQPDESYKDFNQVKRQKKQQQSARG